MREKNVLTYRYLSDNDRFADVVNGGIFKGKQIIHADELEEMEGFSDLVLKDKKSGKKVSIQKYRDIEKKARFGVKFLLLAVENQSEVHHAMPVRNLIYDAANYDAQVRAYGKQHREKKDLTKEEYLSNFSKEDKLQPVITVVVYYGKNPWDGPRTLKEMLDLEGIPKEVEGYINDYAVFILDVCHMEHIEYFQTDLKIVFGFLQSAKNKETLSAFVQENEEALSHIPEDACDVLTEMVNSKELRVVKEKYRKQEGAIDMCQAIRDMIQDGVRQGKLEGEKIGELRGKMEGIDYVNQLNKILIHEQRFEELARAANDKEYQTELFKKYSLI